MALQTRAQVRDRQAVMAEVLADFAANSPAPRQIHNNDFDIHPGFIPPNDAWLDSLRSTTDRAGREVFAIRVKTKIDDDWVSDVNDRFKVLLVAQDRQGNEVEWECGTVTELP